MVYKRPAYATRRKPSPAARPAEQLDEVFFALSHVARRQLVERLGAGGEPTVAQVAAPLAESPAQITKHLAILERAGLILRRIEGREHRLALAPGGMQGALGWVQQNRKLWTHSLDRLEEFLDTDATASPKRAQRAGGVTRKRRRHGS
jgi:DNA-binding transcriptional ArsR family regulator